MATSATNWDLRHSGAAGKAPQEPAGIVLELLPLLPRGRALDIACGTGRHSLLLAGRGQDVTAMDASAVGLARLDARAREVAIEISRGPCAVEALPQPRGSIRIVEADLEKTKLPESAFDLVLCIHYLQRSLFPQMERALRPGGMLLFETFTRAHLEFGNGPKKPEYLLDSHELSAAFPALRTIFYRELRAGKGIASLLAQKPG